MFGYVSANRNDLTEAENIDYQRYYCGLCQQLHKISGFKGQLLLNYDLTFMAILFSGLYELKVEPEEFRCIIHPFSAKHSYINEATKYAADMDIILSYHNLLDDVKDDDSKLKAAYAKLLEPVYKDLSKKYPRQVKAVENYIANLARVEAEKESSLDKASNFTGEMLSELFDWKQDEWSKDLRSMGFYLGKFIYSIDAYDDLKKDEKSGNYNPLSYMKKENPNEFEIFVRMVLTTQMGECARSFERLPIIENASILRNIIYSGVWTKYEYLQMKDKQKNSKEA